MQCTPPFAKGYAQVHLSNCVTVAIAIMAIHAAPKHLWHKGLGLKSKRPTWDNVGGRECQLLVLIEEVAYVLI